MTFFSGLTFCRSAQESWFNRLFKRKSVTEKPQPDASEKVEFDPKNQDRLTLSKAPEGAEAQSKHVAVKSAPQLESQPAKTAAPKEVASPAADRRKRTRRISVCARNADHKVQLFNKNVEFMKPRLGHKPDIRHPPIRKSTWIRTLALCQTEEQLRKVMQMIPLWRDMGLNFDSTFSHAFISTLPNMNLCHSANLFYQGDAYTLINQNMPWNYSAILESTTCLSQWMVLVKCSVRHTTNNRLGSSSL